MIKKRGCLLWEISGGSAKEPSYLFGTMHVKDARAFGRSEAVYEKIAACEVFCTEIALDELSFSSLANLQLPRGQSLEQFLSEKKYAKLKQVLWKTFCLNLDQFRFLKPIVIANLIDERALENEMPEALDRHLWNYAQRLGKTCIGVETVDEQIDLLRKIPLEKQLHSLLSISRNISNQRKRVRTMTHAYEQGDIYRIYQMARRGSGELRRAMIFDRNRLMADRLAELLLQSSLFFAVGAGHLAGDKGLIRLIKKQGFRIRPVA